MAAPVLTLPATAARRVYRARRLVDDHVAIADAPNPVCRLRHLRASLRQVPLGVRVADANPGPWSDEHLRLLLIFVFAAFSVFIAPVRAIDLNDVDRLVLGILLAAEVIPDVRLTEGV